MDRKKETEILELDPTTANLLSHLAETWGVSVEEAVRRAIERANAGNGSPNKEGRLEAFKELQRRLGLTSAKAGKWQDSIREARR